MASTKISTQIQKEAEEILGLMGVKGQVSVSQQEDGVFRVVVETEETGLFIGKHGEAISAFELVLNQIVNRDAKEWSRIVVDTGDYRVKQEERLKFMASEAAARVKESRSPYLLYDLTPQQRRVVHMILSEDPELITESEGEGRDRRLVVKLKN